MQKRDNMPFIQQIIKSAVARFVLYAVIALTVVLVAKHYVKKVTSSSSAVSIEKNDTIDITPMQIRSIESIGEWEFLTINDEELVDTVRKGFFGDDELVRIYYGTLRLGINMKEAHEGWLAMDGDTLRAVLPPVRLLDDSFIDETRTRSFIESGKWSHQDREQMYRRADAMMRRRCLTTDNYKNARLNAEQQFKSMLQSMGYKKVKVEIAN